MPSIQGTQGIWEVPPLAEDRLDHQPILWEFGAPHHLISIGPGDSVTDLRHKLLDGRTGHPESILQGGVAVTSGEMSEGTQGIWEVPPLAEDRLDHQPILWEFGAPHHLISIGPGDSVTDLRHKLLDGRTGHPESILQGGVAVTSGEMSEEFGNMGSSTSGRRPTRPPTNPLGVWGTASPDLNRPW